MDYKLKKDEVNKKFLELEKKKREIDIEQLRLQGEYRLLKLLEKESQEVSIKKEEKVL